MAAVVDDIAYLLIGEIGMMDQRTEIIAVEVELRPYLFHSLLIHLEPPRGTRRHTIHLLYLLHMDKASKLLPITHNAPCQRRPDAGNALEGGSVGSVGIDHRTLGKLFWPLGSQTVIMRLSLCTNPGTLRLFLGPPRTACRPYRLTVEPSLVTGLPHALFGSPFCTAGLVLGMATGLFSLTMCTHAVIKSTGIAVKGIVQTMP